MTEQEQIHLLKQKLALTKEALDNVQQSYHLLSNMISNTRHWASNWKNCSEQSCSSAKMFWDKLENIKVE